LFAPFQRYILPTLQPDTIRINSLSSLVMGRENGSELSRSQS